ncbi:alpha/beta hydrolase [Bradyrhizobium sp. Pha-3]|uniref:alpha/beta hydrolase n=1 Tax=Bradyrhizobium sp. Pha-3 TaxID=208375 RepID=UPI0035D44954
MTGRLTEEAFLRDFAGDLPAAKAKLLYAVQEPFNKALLTGKTTQAAWRKKPGFYAVSTEDRTINPDLQRFMAKRMGAKTIELKASHLSLISHPDDVAQLRRPAQPSESRNEFNLKQLAPMSRARRSACHGAMLSMRLRRVRLR